MAKQLKEYKPEELAERMNDALRRVVDILPPGVYDTGKMANEFQVDATRVAAEQGYDWRLSHVSSALLRGLEYRHAVEAAFAVSCEARVQVRWQEDEGMRVECAVSWAGGSAALPTLAVARATLALDVSQKACLVEAVLWNALGLRGKTKADGKAWVAGVRVWDQWNQTAIKRVRKALNG